MTLIYYLLYKRNKSESAPAGVTILESRSTDALIWDHVDKAWVYDPESAHQLIFDLRNREMFREVDRAEAEQVTPGVTGAEPLPDEETIRWLFRWKGQPPGLDPL